jgi:hypothetical protein
MLQLNLHYGESLGIPHIMFNMQHNTCHITGTTSQSTSGDSLGNPTTRLIHATWTHVFFTTWTQHGSGSTLNPWFLVLPLQMNPRP